MSGKCAVGVITIHERSCAKHQGKDTTKLRPCFDNLSDHTHSILKSLGYLRRCISTSITAILVSRLLVTHTKPSAAPQTEPQIPLSLMLMIISMVTIFLFLSYLLLKTIGMHSHRATGLTGRIHHECSLHEIASIIKMI